MEPIIVTSATDLQILIIKAVREAISETGPTNNQEKKPLTIKEASEYLHLSVSALYRYTSLRLIPHQKPGKTLYFYKHELDDWLKSHRKLTRDQLKDFSQLKKGGAK